MFEKPSLAQPSAASGSRQVVHVDVESGDSSPASTSRQVKPAPKAMPKVQSAPLEANTVRPKITPAKKEPSFHEFWLRSGVEDAPMATDVMCGLNHPVARAMVWIGWDVFLVDKVLHDSHDLSQYHTRTFVMERAVSHPRSAAVMVAMTCETFTRARDKPIPGHNHPPQSLRDEDNPMGKPNLDKDQQTRVTEANDMASWTGKLLEEANQHAIGGVGENPKNAFYWEVPEVAELLNITPFYDVNYEACTQGGARCKQQKLRTNMAEVAQFVKGKCYHTHSLSEWTPYRTVEGSWYFPSREEAEYTAQLAWNLALSFTAWGIQHRPDVCRLRVHRPLPPDETGDRQGWTEFHPDLLRSMQMAQIGARLGYPPPKCEDRPKNKLLRLDSMSKEDWKDPWIYIGNGNRQLGLKPTSWSNTRSTGGAGEKMLGYSQWLFNQSEGALVKWAKELEGFNLVTDTPSGEPCHGEAILELLFRVKLAQEQMPQELNAAVTACGTEQFVAKVHIHGKKRQVSIHQTGVLRRGLKLAASALTLMQQGASERIPAAMPMQFQQDVIQKAVYKMFPEEVVKDAPFPVLEDILQDEIFVAYVGYLQDQDMLDCQIAYNHWQKVPGVQTGVMDSAKAEDPVVPYLLGEDAHFEAACELALSDDNPWARDAVADNELKFAAWNTVRHYKDLNKFREHCSEVFECLTARMAAFNEHLRTFMPTHVQDVSGHLNVGTVALLILLMAWRDILLPRRLLFGFPAIRDLDALGIFSPVLEEAPCLTVEELLVESQRVKAALEHDPVSEDVQFLYESCETEFKKGWTFPAMTAIEVDNFFQNKGWTVTPSFCHTQPCGKKRRIDNAKRGLLNKASRWHDKQHMASAFFPAVCCKLLIQEFVHADIPIPEDIRAESGTEDMPDAFRMLAVMLKHLRFNTVAVRHPDTLEWLFYIVKACLFGYSTSVHNFGRWSRFHEAVCRRIASLLWAMYVDDGQCTDLNYALGASKAVARSIFKATGAKLAEPKSTPMSGQNVFLGLCHDLTKVFRQGIIEFWPKESLTAKVVSMAEEAIQVGAEVTPAMASKFRGVTGFTNHGMMGDLGKAVAGAFKQRQYSDQAPWYVSHALRRAYSYHLMLARMNIRRVIELNPPEFLPLVIASDAQADTAPTGGLLLWDPETDLRVGAWTSFDSEILRQWGYDRTDGVIAACEGAMLPLGLLEFATHVRNRKAFWFLDNSNGLYSHFKGNAKTAVQDRNVAIARIFCFHAKCQLWYEYVDSKSNWADGISRLLSNDPWSKAHGFELHSFRCSSKWWAYTLKELFLAVKQYVEQAYQSSVGK